jgi:hypothetical protein
MRCKEVFKVSTMPRIRTIKPEFFSHEDLAQKSAHARLLAIGLLTLADCEGRLRWVPMQVHSQVFPWEAEVKIEVLLGELIECNYVVHYEVDGKRYVEICNFKKHQRLSGKEASFDSRLPPPPKKPTKTLVETGEATGKHSGASPGSSEKPLGTGEQGNRGTEEKREREDAGKEFSKSWTRWKLHSLDKGKSINGISEETQLMQLAQAYPDVDDRIAAIEYAIGKNWANINLGGDHNRPPPETRSNGRRQKTTFEEVGL